MFGKLLQWLVGGLLIACWFGALYERSYTDGRLRIDVDDEGVFLGLSILLAGWMVAISLRGAGSSKRLPSDYVNFAKTLGNRSLTAEQLGEKAGEESTQSLDQNGQPTKRIELSTQQHRSLERLIYEGKICLHEGHYSMPAERQAR